MEYTRIFDFESNKLLQLFTLLKATDKGHSLEMLSEELAINSKTILRHLKKLQQQFKQHQLGEKLTIRSREKNCFCIERENDWYLELFRVRYLSSIPEIHFLKVVIEEKKIEANQLAEEMCISESSLRKRVKKINLWLKEMDIQLKRGTYEFMGEEAQIQTFILDFYWFVYQGTKTTFLQRRKEQTKRLTNQLFHFFQLQINELQKETFFRMVQITVWRCRRGKRMSIKEEWNQYLRNSPLYSYFIQMMEHNGAMGFLEIEELSYLYLMIQAKFFPYFSSSIQTYLIREHYLKKTTSYTHTVTLANQFKQEFWEKEFDYSKESIIAFLGFHLYYELVSGFDFERGQAIENLEGMYPKFTAKIKNCVSIQYKEHSLGRIPKNALYYRSFMILSSLISPLYNEKKVFICLMTDLTIENEQELGRRITNFFYGKVNVTVIYARTISSIEYSDVILTTVFYQNMIKKYTQPVLVIDLDFSETLFFEIENILKKLNDEALS